MSKEQMLQDYITVNERIIKFYELYPTGRIITELVSWQDGVIIMKAYSYRHQDDALPASTGHTYEKEGSSYINKTSALENAETSVVGRCLANLGLEIKRSVASREEVQNAIQQQDDLKNEDKHGFTQLKDLYVELKGDESGFKQWHDQMKSKGYSNANMREVLNKRREKSNEQSAS